MVDRLLSMQNVKAKTVQGRNTSNFRSRDSDAATPLLDVSFIQLYILVVGIIAPATVAVASVFF